MNYIFTCKFCSNSGLETYRRTSATIPQMCITTIANLQRKTEKDGTPRYFFSVKEIIQFMDMYWESITTLARKQTNTWHSTIVKTLQTHQNLFLAQDNMQNEFHYGLSDADLTTIKPHYERAQKDEGMLRA
jgi:Set1/Ash2 histone methyltransferase complex subunit ASH2